MSEMYSEMFYPQVSVSSEPDFIIQTVPSTPFANAQTFYYCGWLGFKDKNCTDVCDKYVGYNATCSDGFGGSLHKISGFLP